MSIHNKIAEYRDWKSGVKHCTFNPTGPGVVRMHLVPPKFSLFASQSYILILNGYYLLPIGYSWALMLSEFIREANSFDGKPISDEDVEKIIGSAVGATHRAYPFSSAAEMREDLDYMLDIIFEIARGGKPDAYIERLSVRSYAKNMSAPHRMDLMVSAMTDEHGAWKCNQKCMFCYAAGQCWSGAGELSTEEWKKAINKLRVAGVPMITFTGGEPTEREDILELINYSRWFITRLNTNGINLSQTFVKSLKEASLDSLQITLYSSDEAIHNKLVGAERFSDTVHGIENSVRAGLDVSINTPLCSLNKNYIDTLRWIHARGVRFVTLSGLIATGGAENKHESYDLSEAELYSIVREAKAFCDENGMEMDFTSPGLISSDKLEAIFLNVPACGAALSNMAIAPDGTVVPCQSWLDGGAALGNILTDDFKAIWNNELCLRLRKMSDTEALACPFREEGKNDG